MHNRIRLKFRFGNNIVIGQEGVDRDRQLKQEHRQNVFDKNNKKRLKTTHYLVGIRMKLISEQYVIFVVI